MSTNDDDEKYDIILPEKYSLKRVYTYQPYSYHRIIEILRNNGMYLELIVWYKAYRYGNTKQRYNVREIGTGRLIRENLYLDDLRQILARLDYPLHEPESVTRNQGAEQFLQAVKQISNY